MKMIYLDNAATTKIDPEVLEEMMPYLTEEYGNPGSIYSLGSRANRAVDLAREQVARLFGTEDPSKIIFTSSGSEANNMAFEMARDFLDIFDSHHIILSATEHQSTIEKVVNGMWHGNKNNFDHTYVYPNSDGIITGEAVANAINIDTGIVSVMHANNETGMYNDIGDIASLCKELHILYHADCVQSAGCEEILADERGISFASISSHKLHGPKGVGALFVSNKNCITPFIYGGKDQEYGLRAGTQNVASIVGFGRACEIAYENMEANKKYLEELKTKFLYDLQYSLRNHELSELLNINFYQGNKTISLSFDGIDAETLIILLDSVYKTAISSGSACESHRHEPSRVLKAYGLTDEEAMNTIRVSFSRMNTFEEVQQAAYNISGAVKMLHK